MVGGYIGFGTEDPPGAATLTVDVTDLTGIALSFRRTILIKKTQWTVDRIDLPPSVSGILDDPNVSINEQNRLNAIYSDVTARRWRDSWTSPVDTSIPISGYFGEQRSFNGGPVGGHHGGTDFGASAGTPVHATNDGVVVLAETLAVRGNMVIIDHGGGVFSGYAHMQAMQVTAGDLVAQGDLIGHVGTTGLSTGAHLHWELSVAGILVDGLRWLDGTQGF
jgi:murein DD-endopeptidase MepM/ murein hydrolase activator NlpD